MTEPLTIRLFGVPQILIGGKPPQTMPTRKGMLLLAMLAVNRARPMDRSALAYDLWGDTTEARARRNLNTEIWRLRAILGDAILSDAKTVGFSPELSCRIDIMEFESVDDSSGIEALEAALSAYRGEFLGGLYDDWAILKREHYRDRYIHYLDRAARLYQSSFMPQKAIGAIKSILQCNPIHEESHQRLMRLYMETGDHVAAVRQYRQCADILKRELELQPLPETQALYEWVLKQSRQAADSFAALQPGRVYVGREDYLRLLEKQWAELKPGQARSVVITGESGIGKTRLVEHWLAGIGSRAIVLKGHCHETNRRISYHPILEMLKNGIALYGAAELERLPAAVLRDINLLSPVSFPGQAVETKPEAASSFAREQSMFSLARGLKAWSDRETPLLVFLDDAQWADDETLDLLSTLREDGDVPVFLIVTHRPEPLALADARRMDARIGKLDDFSIALNPLTRRETVELIRRMGGMSEAPREFGERIYAETEGNPLFIVESLKGLFDTGHLSTNAEGAWTASVEKPLGSLTRLPLSNSLRDAIQKRVERLGLHQRNLLAAASVIGSEFDRSALVSVSGMKTADFDEALPSLLRSGLIAQAGGGYRFTHVKIQETILASLSDETRKALHSKAALHFESLPEYYGKSESLALHYFHAGGFNKALDYYERAGEREMSLHAYKVASFHFESAAGLCSPAGMEERRFPLLMKRYLCLWTVESDHDLLQEILEQAKEDAEVTGRADYLAQVCFYRGVNLVSRGIWDEGSGELKRALEFSIRAGLAEFEMKARLELANIHGHNLEFRDASDHAQAGLEIARRLGNFHMEARARWEIAEFNESITGQAEVGSQIANEAMQKDAVELLIEMGSSCVGSLYYAGNFGGALELGERILEYGRGRGLTSVLGRSVQRVLARVYCEIGEYERAASLASESLRLSRLSGYLYGQMRSLTCLGVSHAGLEQLDEALSGLNRAANLCEGIGSKGDLLTIKLATAALLIQFSDAAHLEAAESLLGEVKAGARESASAEIEASALSHLAQVCLMRGRLQESLRLSESAVHVLENNPRRAILPAPLAYFIRARALHAAGEGRHREPLALARRNLYCRAMTLPRGLRRVFLRGVPLNRAILSMR